MSKAVSTEIVLYYFESPCSTVEVKRVLSYCNLNSIPLIIADNCLSSSQSTNIVSSTSYYIRFPVDDQTLKIHLSRAFLSINREQLNENHKKKLQLAIQILEILNTQKAFNIVVKEVIFLIKIFTGYDEVAIKITEKNGASFFESVNKEKSLNGLCRKNIDLKVDQQNNTCTSCICSLVLDKDINKEQLPFITSGGSFWSNDFFQTLEEYSDTFLSYGFNIDTFKDYYNSVALIPLSANNRVIGIMQVCSENKNAFDEETISFLERINMSIGIALASKKMQIELEESFAHIEESRLLLDSILTGIQAAVILIDPATNKIAYANLNAEKLLKHNTESLIGEICTQVACNIDNKDNLHKEYTITFPDKTLIPISRSVLDVKWKGKDHLALIFFDLTEKKMLERQLSIAQKMESIGHLAAGIAHEINTPIQYIGDNTQFIKDVVNDFLIFYDKFQEIVETLSTEKQEKFKEISSDLDIEFVKNEVPLAINQSLEGIKRVSTIVQAMKMFSHPGVEEKTVIDINSAIKNTTTVTRNEWKYDAEVILELDLKNPKILGNAVDINQVLLNIIVNSAHAIKEAKKSKTIEGIIKITTSTENGYVLIKIQDNGCGIPEAISNKVFDHFFTTKEVGKGTGQGLSICHNIITEKHGGQIYFESADGAGTTFTIKLKEAEA